MIDSIVKLTEKISELVSYRAKVDAHFFSTHIEPVFLAMTTIHTEYLQVFEEVHRELTQGVSPQLISEKLLFRRLPGEALRSSIRARVNALALLEGSGTELFFLSVARYFDHPYKEKIAFVRRDERPDEIIGSTHFDAMREKLAKTLVSMVLSSEDNAFSRKELVKDQDSLKAHTRMVLLTAELLSQLRSEWENISRLYAMLRIRFLKLP